MRAYPVPVQLLEPEERIIGGYLTFRQLIYLIAGFALGGGLTVAMSFLPIILRIMVCMLFVTVGVCFAFFKPYDTNLDVFLYRWFEWRFKPRELYVRGDD
jgi:dihydrofolate reductase